MCELQGYGSSSHVLLPPLQLSLVLETEGLRSTVLNLKCCVFQASFLRVWPGFRQWYMIYAFSLVKCGKQMRVAGHWDDGILELFVSVRYHAQGS